MPSCAPRNSRCSRWSADPSPAASPAVLASRMLALNATEAVLSRHKLLDEAFERHPVFPALAGRDEAFPFHLASTMLRLGQIRRAHRCFPRPAASPTTSAGTQPAPPRGSAARIPANARARRGAYTAVELARRRRDGSHGALINAVLRRLAGEGARWAETQDTARLKPRIGCGTPGRRLTAELWRCRSPRFISRNRRST